jgi:hypothetical protein
VNRVEFKYPISLECKYLLLKACPTDSQELHVKGALVSILHAAEDQHPESKRILTSIGSHLYHLQLLLINFHLGPKSVLQK